MADIKQKFIQTYGLTVATAIAYAMNTEFSKVLAQQMTFFSQSNEVDAISRVHGQIDELKDIMVKNIGKYIVYKLIRIFIHLYRLWWFIVLLYVLFIYVSDNLRDRGEKLELLVNKTENLSNNVSITFC